ncbi:cell envelope biogenesis protein TolA [Nocardiopsis quinghaiensis]|uniref:cell envelope biogenesis protein TolA n=1 Tax=Nocardiopsis quinghaiensis TaxID=464995 RepID=UPI00123C3F5A|nr:cell envelope biogenesis protein TolA [Nocardiopsis quinghaiensis]
MKFELVEPSAGSVSTTGPRHPAPADEDSAGQAPPTAPEPDETSVKPVGERMARTVRGVRASLNLLQAHVTEQSTAEAHRSAASAPAAGPGAAFHPHRFTASPKGDGR